MTDPEFVSVEVLLKRWGMDRRTLDKLVDCGLLPCLDFPVVRVRRFSWADVQRFEQAHFTTASRVPL